MIQDKIFFDEKDPTGVSYNTPFTVYGSYEGRLWSKTPSGEIKYYTQNSDLSVYATTGSNSFNGNQTVTGSLTVTGQVVAQTLNVQQVTSSIVYSSGSNIFGNSLANTQQFTGSVSVTGSLTVNGAGTFASSITAASGLINGTTDAFFDLNRSAGGNASRVRFQTTGSDEFEIGLKGGVAGFHITKGDATELVTVLSSGNVGIGIPSPSSKLDISGSAGNITSDMGNGTILNLDGGTISSTNFGVGIGFIRIGSQMAYIKAARENASDEAAYLAFATQTGGGTHPERLRITSGGDIGIGRIPSSGYKVDIQGNGGLRILDNDVLRSIILTPPTSAGASANLESSSANGLTLNSSNASGVLLFNTAGAERMRITSGGNVGIGVAPAAWASPAAGKVIQLGNRASAFSYNNQTLDLATNIYFDGNDYRYLESASATLLRSDTSNGSFAFYNAASGTSGNVVSFSERMLITSDGYLRMASGTGGIQFNGDTAAVNALDDYEEGTWTPVPTSSGATFDSIVNGTYTKIGRLVFITCEIDNSSAPTGTLTNEMSITNLPFTSLSSMRFGASLAIGFEVAIDFPSGGLGIQARIPANTSIISLRFTKDDASGDDFLASNFDNSDARISLAGCYPI
jgi:hypothetical protein